MSSSPPHLYPVVVLQDRYGGTYSGGAWLAIANADEAVGDEGAARIVWAMGEEGPSGCDLTAGSFWSEPPRWIQARATPDAAVGALEEPDSRERAQVLLPGA